MGLTSQALTTEAGGPAPTTEYRAHLDGLRAVAVYLVVLFHAGTGRFSGGFIGVDVFFVLSGYLVTQLLLRDLDGDGSISFRRFYARRFRRLLPAAFVVLIVTAAVYTAIASPAEVLGAVDALQGRVPLRRELVLHPRVDGLLRCRTSTTNPVLQFWSLAVEEQFYLLWPLILGGLYWAARTLAARRVGAIRVAVAAGAIASLAWALAFRDIEPGPGVLRHRHPRVPTARRRADRTLARIRRVAHARYRRTMLAATIVSLVVLVLLGTSVLDVDPIVRGALVTVVTALVIVSLEAAPGGPAKKLLSIEPVVYLGKISYGTYLWHWPVVLVALSLWKLGSLAMLGLVALLATGLASLSYQLLERPVRMSLFLERHRIAVISTGLVVSIGSAVVLIPAIVDPRSAKIANVQLSAVNGSTASSAGLDLKEIYLEGFGTETKCLDGTPEDCTIVKGHGRHVLLMGDSNAATLTPAFTKIAEAEDLTLSAVVSLGCRWQRDLYYSTAEIRERCRKEKEDAYDRVIPALDPDLIVLVNAHEDQGHLPPNASDVDDATLRSMTAASLKELAADGSRTSS